MKTRARSEPARDLAPVPQQVGLDPNVPKASTPVPASSRVPAARDPQAWIPIGVWIASSLLLVRQIAVYGSRVLHDDDWPLLRLLRDGSDFQAPNTWWIAGQPADALTRATFKALVDGCHDLRAGSWCAALLLIAVAWACVRAAARLRGRAHVTDALFPLVLLHGAQGASILDSSQLGFALGNALVLLGTLEMAASAGPPRTRTLLLVTVAGVLLPFTWIGGAAQGLVCAVWLAASGFAGRVLPAPVDRRTAWVALSAALAIAATVAWVVAHHAFPAGFIAPPPLRIATAALHFSSRGLGDPAGLFRPVGSVLVGVFLLWSAFVLARGSATGASDRLRRAGLCAALIAGCAAAIVVGWHRMLRGDSGALDVRFGPVASPLWCAFALAAAFAWQQRAARGLAWTLLVVFATCALPNFVAGERAGLEHRRAARTIEEDFRQGLTLREIAAARWFRKESSPERFLAALEQLEELRLGPFESGPYVPDHTRPTPPMEMLRTPPLNWRVTRDLVASEEAGACVLPTPSGREIFFQVGPDPLGVAGAFGVRSSVVETGLATPVRFEVRCVRVDGTSDLLFARTLDPVEHAPDRGEQRFQVRLDPTVAFGKVWVCATWESTPDEAPIAYWRDVLVR